MPSGPRCDSFITPPGNAAVPTDQAGAGEISIGTETEYLVHYYRDRTHLFRSRAAPLGVLVHVHLHDPGSSGDVAGQLVQTHEGLGRVVNALEAAKELKEGNDDVRIVFDGAGTAARAA